MIENLGHMSPNAKRQDQDRAELNQFSTHATYDALLQSLDKKKFESRQYYALPPEENVTVSAAPSVRAKRKGDSVCRIARQVARNPRRHSPRG
jgi:hypothetical protein